MMKKQVLFYTTLLNPYHFCVLFLVSFGFFFPRMAFGDTPDSKSILSSLSNNENLVHLWSFNGTIQDGVGNAITSTLPSITQPFPISSVLFSEGIFDHALTLGDSSTQLVTNEFHVKNQITMAALVYVQELPPVDQVAVLLSHHFTASLILMGDGSVLMGVAEKWKWDDVYSPLGIIEPGQWYLIVGSYDQKNIRLFIFTKCYQRSNDYIKEKPDDHFYWAYAVTKQTDVKMNEFPLPWSIGGCSEDCDPKVYTNFVGKMDEVGIWEKGLTYEQVEEAMDPWIEKFKVTVPAKIIIPKEETGINEIRIVDGNENILERRIPAYDPKTNQLTHVQYLDRHDDPIFFYDYQYDEQGLVSAQKTSSLDEVSLLSMDREEISASQPWKKRKINNPIQKETYLFEREFDTQNRCIRETRTITTPGSKNTSKILIEFQYNKFNKPVAVYYYRTKPKVSKKSASDASKAEASKVNLSSSEDTNKELIKYLEYSYTEWNVPNYIVEHDSKNEIVKVIQFHYMNMHYFFKIEVWKPKVGLTDYKLFPIYDSFRIDHVWQFKYLKKAVTPDDPEASLLLEPWQTEPYTLLY